MAKTDFRNEEGECTATGCEDHDNRIGYSRYIGSPYCKHIARIDGEWVCTRPEKRRGGVVTREEYAIRLKENNRAKNTADFMALKEYLHSGIVYKIGDTLTDKSRRAFGVVEKLNYTKGHTGNSPEIVYICRQLTAKLKPRVNYETVYIYSNSATLIKEASNG